MFYTLSDFLVYFTIFCSTARKHELKVLGLCPMFDHLHVLFDAEHREDVAPCIGEYSRRYSRAFNESINSKGPLFNSGFGCAVKTGDKAIRTACSYLYNNPCEKGLCKRSEDYRWTFLAYAASPHPFSEKIRLDKASRKLRQSLKEIKFYRDADKALSYVVLKRLFFGLDKTEKEQLTDCIISSYNCLDYESLISLYGSYDKMCLAFASNQGSEYDIAETFEPGSHRIYPYISKTIVTKLGFTNVKDVFNIPRTRQVSIANTLLKTTPAQAWQLRKYFQWPKDLSAGA